MDSSTWVVGLARKFCHELQEEGRRFKLGICTKIDDGEVWWRVASTVSAGGRDQEIRPGVRSRDHRPVDDPSDSRFQEA